MKIKATPVFTIRFLRYIALISASFAIIICLLIIVNYMQLQRADPLNASTLKILNEQLNNHPEDQQLRDEIRTLDLLARKAYFTSQWQIRFGGYLLLVCILVVVVCLKTTDYVKKTMPVEPSAKPDTFWIDRAINRKWVTFAAIGIMVTTMILAVLSHHDLGKMFQSAASGLVKNANSGSGGKDSAASAQNNNPSEESALASGDSVSSKLTEGYPTWKEIIQNSPSFRGPGGNGIVYQRSIPTNWDGKSGKNIKWKTAVPLPGYNSPIVWNDMVFLSGANEIKREVYCFDASTGKIRWTTRVEKIAGSPAKAPAVSKETGQSAPTMTTDGRRVYAIFANGDLVALDLDGNMVWSKNLGLPVNHYGYSSSLMMYHDLVIVQYDQRGSASVMALAGKSGEIVWKTSRNVKISWSSPILINTGKRNELILTAEPTVASYNPATGKELWKMDCISGEVGPSAAYADGIVFSVNDYSKLCAVQIGETPRILWESTDYLSDVPSPVATDKYLFLITSYGTAVCYDAKTGTKYWEHDFENTIYASPMLAGGLVFIMDKQGIMHIFKADKNFSSIAEPRLGEGSVCTPAMVDGRIYLRGDKNLFCVEK